MASNIVDGISRFGICVQNPSHHIFALAREKLWEGVISSHDFLIEVTGFRIFKWQISAYHCVKDDAARPNVCFKAVVSFASNHFRCRVARRTAGGFQCRTCLVHVTEAEIDNFKSHVVIKEKIFWFEISMAYSALVDVFDSGNELQVEFAGLFFAETGVSDNIVEQFSPICVLHYHVEFFFGFDYFVQLNDIWMSDLLEDFDFSCNPLNVFLVVDFVLFQDLDGHFFACQGVLAQFHKAECAFAEMLACRYGVSEIIILMTYQ